MLRSLPYLPNQGGASIPALAWPHHERRLDLAGLLTLLFGIQQDIFGLIIGLQISLGKHVGEHKHLSGQRFGGRRSRRRRRGRG